MLSFYYGSAQQQRPALYANSQRQSIVVSYFDVALYSATENTFFLKVYFSSVEYVFPFSQGFVLNLLCLLVYFLRRIIAPLNSSHPEQYFSLKARATWVSRKRYHSDLLCSQNYSTYSTIIDVGNSSDLFMFTVAPFLSLALNVGFQVDCYVNSRPLLKVCFALFRSNISLLNSIQHYMLNILLFVVYSQP